MKIKVNLENLTLGDYEKLQTRDGLTLTEQLDLLDKFIEGSVREIPLKDMNDLMDAIELAVNEVVDPNLD